MSANFFDVNDRTLDPSEVHRKSKEELYETAFNKDQRAILDEMSSGGGGSAPLMCTVDEETGVLNKTFGEVYNAFFLNGQTVLLRLNYNAADYSGDYSILHSVFIFSSEDGYSANVEFHGALFYTSSYYPSFDELMDSDLIMGD